MYRFNFRTALTDRDFLDVLADVWHTADHGQFHHGVFGRPLRTPLSGASASK